MIEIIEIEVRGRVGIGKSATAASIRDLLRDLGYCVAFPSWWDGQTDPQAAMDAVWPGEGEEGV